MNCTNCGHELSENDKFCPSCGSPVQCDEAGIPVEGEEAVSNVTEQPEIPRNNVSEIKIESKASETPPFMQNERGTDIYANADSPEISDDAFDRKRNDKKFLKIIVVAVAAVIVLTLSISYFYIKNKIDNLCGTWDLESVEINDTTLSIDKLEALSGNANGTIKFLIVIAKDGKAYLYNGNKVTRDWELTDDGAKIGDRECTLEDGLLSFEDDDGVIWNFEKTSDSQDISDVTSNSKASSAQQSKSTNSANTEKAAASAEKSEDTYEHNKYYDIVEIGSYTTSIGDTVVIHKVLAKKSISVSADLLAYDADGAVIGKDSDDIVLTEGQYNFFRYYFDGDVTNASFKANANMKNNSKERNAVEMVTYSKSGNNVYVTFKQTSDEISYFAKFKLLFYNGNQIVDSEDGYFSTRAKNLNGKGSTDVAEIWAYGITFDRIDYVFEP